MAYATDFDPSVTISFVSAACVAGTTSTFTSTVTTNAVINGKFTTALTAQTNTASPTTDWATGASFVPLTPNQTCTLVFGINAAGTLKLCQGQVIACGIGVTTTVGSLIQDPQFPGLPNDFVALAYTVVRTAPSAATWTPGSSNWTASGVSCSTFQNVAWLPARPQAS